LEHLILVGSIIFKWIKEIGWVRIGTSGVLCSCEHGNEPVVSIKGEEFLD
jgi:hypothetical protein